MMGFSRIGRIAATAIAAAAVGFLAAAPAAVAEPSSGGSITGSGTAHTLNLDLNFSVSAHENGGSGPFGTFSAHGAIQDLIGGSQLLPFHFKGPITCLDIQGHNAGLFYPIEESESPIFSGHFGVLIFIHDSGSSGQPDQFGFLGPLPITASPICPPGPTPFTVSKGDFTIHDGS